MSWIREGLELLYFRAVIDPALRMPIGLAGLVILAVHRTWASAAICACALLTAYALANELLFRDSARTKRDVLAFLRDYRGARFARISTERFAEHFDLTFLIPSFFGKGRLAARIAPRIRVYAVRSGSAGARAPASPRAYVSAVALDTYIFLRDSVAEMRPEIHFRLAHELGHASAIYIANAQRNVIGLTCVYFSIVWIAVTAEWSWWLATWTVVQLLACSFAGEAFRRFRQHEHFYAEVAADYLAARHLTDGEVKELLATGIASALVQADPAFDDAQTAERRTLLVDHLEARGRGARADIPETYMNYSFQHPASLKILAFLHLGYIVTISATMTPSIVASAAFMAPVLAHFLSTVRQDAEFQVSIDKILKAASTEGTERVPV